MNYRSIATLNRQMIAWQAVLPRDLDLIVGIPRSGLLAANILALHMDLPLADLDTFLAGRSFRGGGRRGEPSLSQRRRVLVLDDSINSGGQMDKVRRRVAEAKLPHEVLYAAVCARPGTEHKVDYYCEVLDNPRLFEWNIMHHSILLSSCLDIDGVLCVDPTEDENDDADRYKRFLAEARPLFVPSVPVGWLVTSRLARYREPTEKWLAASGIQYRHLVMMDLPDKVARTTASTHSSHKAGVYLSTGADLFIESSLPQAMAIANLSGKHVFCVEIGEMIMPMLHTEGGRLTTPTACPAPAFSGVPSDGSWASELQAAVQDVLDVVPVDQTFILVDEDTWGVREVFAGRRPRQFVEKDGQYWGAPEDDTTAICELDRMRQAGATYIVFGWPAFWWLDHFRGFADYLAATARCLLRNKRVVIFGLEDRSAQREGQRS